MRPQMRTSKSEVETAELVMVSEPAVSGTFVGVGLAPSEAEALLSTLPENMVQSHVAEYATYRHIFPHYRAAASQEPAHSARADAVRHGRGAAILGCMCRLPAPISRPGP